MDRDKELHDSNLAEMDTTHKQAVDAVHKKYPVRESKFC